MLQTWVDRTVGFHGFDSDVSGQVRDWVISLTRAKWAAATDAETRMGLKKALAGLYHDSARFGEARPLFEAVLAHRQSTLGDGHAKTLNSLVGLADVDLQLEGVDQALDRYTEAYQARRALQGEEHADTVYCLNGMANCYARQERYEEAEKCYEKVSGGPFPFIHLVFPLCSSSYLAEVVRKSGTFSYIPRIYSLPTFVLHQHLTPRLMHIITNFTTMHHLAATLR